MRKTVADPLAPGKFCRPSAKVQRKCSSSLAQSPVPPLGPIPAMPKPLRVIRTPDGR